MKKLIAGLVLLTSAVSVAQENQGQAYFPKTEVEQKAILDVISMAGEKAVSYEGRSKLKVTPMITVPVLDGRLTSKTEFAVRLANNAEFLSCQAKKFMKFDPTVLDFNSKNYNGLLADIHESNPNVQYPVVSMHCTVQSTDKNVVNSDYYGTFQFETDKAGHVKRMLGQEEDYLNEAQVEARLEQQAQAPETSSPESK